jgi:ABC-type sugar transport system permease subunit
MIHQRLFNTQRKFAPYVFVSPFIIILLTFSLYPLIKSLILSFYITNGPKSQVFVGFENFRFMFTDPDFRKAVKNTSVFAFFSVFLQLPLSLLLALMLNSKLVKGRNIFRLSFFSPNLVGQVFVAVIFMIVFIPQYGLLNRMLHALFGVARDTHWLGRPHLVMPSLILASLWMYVGFNMIYFLAALQAVDLDLYDAAQVDGANSWQQFLHVTMPGIRHVAVFVIVLSTIGSFQLFELPFVMLGNTGERENAGLTIVMYLYTNGFVTGDLGYASAIGWSLALGVLAISLLQLRFSGTWRARP